ncbi:hypothetical protein HAX54_042899 [Datura stramonium]|uniref:Uncharacterized protein n=1 Tax=Datura stramonium TaxID=4076 RepID=A0ABS8W428_DATST|nr:hypothetical protein [Datura stramonium]
MALVRREEGCEEKRERESGGLVCWLFSGEIRLLVGRGEKMRGQFCLGFASLEAEEGGQNKRNIGRQLLDGAGGLGFVGGEGDAGGDVVEEENNGGTGEGEYRGVVFGGLLMLYWYGGWRF